MLRRRATTAPLIRNPLAMTENLQYRDAKPSRKRGCIILLAVVAGPVALCARQLREPGRRAARIRRAIRPGMKVEDVERLLTGRHYCFYQVMKDDEWQSVSREEFMRGLMDRAAGTPTAARLQLTFMGASSRSSRRTRTRPRASPT